MITWIASAALALAPLPQQDAAERVDELEGLVELAQHAFEAGDLERARGVLEETAGLARDTGHYESEELARIFVELDRLGGACSMLGVQRVAREWRLARCERRLPQDHLDRLRAEGELGNVLFLLADLEGARAHYAAAHAAYARLLPEDHPERLATKGNLGAALYALGDLEGARPLLAEVHAAYERLRPEDDASLLNSKTNLASVLYDLGELQEALALRRHVHELYERDLPPDHSELLTARANLANSLRDHGDAEGALALRQQVHAARERLLPKGHPDRLNAMANLAISLDDLGDLEGARALQEQVHAACVRRLPEGHPQRLLAAENLGVTLRQLGEVEPAHALFEHVHAARAALPEEHPLRLRIETNLATTFYELGDFESAHALFARVHAAYERLLPADHPELLRTKTNLATTRFELGDFEGAGALREHVRAAYERSLPGDHPSRLSAEQDLALTLLELGDLEEVCNLLQAAQLGIEERLVTAVGASLRERGAVCVSEGERVSLFLLLGAAGGCDARGLFGLIETRRHVANAAPVAARSDSASALARRREWSQASRRLASLVTGGPRDRDDVEAWRVEIARAAVQRDAAQGRYFELLSEGTLVEPIRAASLARALPDGALAVGFLRHADWKLDEETGRRVRTTDGLLAMTVAADGSVERIPLGSAVAIEELVRAWRLALGKPVLRGETVGARSDEPEAGKALRRAVLDPLLRGFEGKTLYVALDDALHLVPFDALPLDDGDRVGDRYRIVDEVSFGRLVAPRAPSRAEPSLLALGDADFDSELEADAPDDLEAPGPDPSDRAGAFEHWDRLFGTKGELTALEVLFHETFGSAPVLLSREHATKAALFERAPGARFVHVATHGWFAPETILALGDRATARPFSMSLEETVVGFAPMTLCGLCLAGANRGRNERGRVPGLVTAEELASLDLSQCELAVLSACETNVGIRRAGLGLQSLRAALLGAGARTAITSLWKVDDDAARELMQAFYTNLWSHRMGVAEALWSAKKSLRERGYPVSAWAAWVLTGDPD